MKPWFTVLSVIVLSTPVFAANFDSLECKSRKGGNSGIDLTLTAHYLGIDSDSANLNTIEARATTELGGEKSTQIGRKDYLSSDQNYKPRKYVNHVRLDLTKLVDTENFGSFTPGNECYIYVMIPLKAKTKFEAPVTVNCEQGGGAMTLECTAKKSNH